MDFKTLVSRRCSVRDYASRPVESEKLDALLEAARLAPSACNLQPWQFIVVRSDEAKAQLRSCYEREWLGTAPLYLLICSDRTQSWKRSHDGKDHADIDVAIAAEHICLAATELGLGSCWVCHFDAYRCADLFDLPRGLDPVVIIPIGYPADPSVFDRTPKRRKSTNEVVEFR